MKRTLAYLALFALLVELAIALLLHPADLADVRREQASALPKTQCLVLGDSVANQIAPPFEGAPIRKFAARYGHAGTLGDPRGSQAQQLDGRCTFLTTTAGATRLGDVFLLRRAIESGAHPTVVHLVLSPGGWAAGRVGNPYFEDGFTQRFASPRDIWETFELTSDWQLAGRQAALGWLPSVRARGPYGQRVLLALVPEPPQHPAPKTPWRISAWNYLALTSIAKLTEGVRARLVVHMAPFSSASFRPSELSAYSSEMARLGLTSGPIPEPWDESLFRDGTHLKHDEVHKLVRWFLEELDATDEPAAHLSR